MTGQKTVGASSPAGGGAPSSHGEAGDRGSDLVRHLVGDRTPDILDTLANLSNDEVFTPPELANSILDLLPAEVWSDPTLRFLDPGVKTGVFLREVAKRLMVGLAEAIPDETERRTHIFQNMLYGLAITELTALMARRTLYYTTHADNPNLSAVPMSAPDGNIHYSPVAHEFDKGSCLHCGASQKTHDRGDERETHAYAFIHPNALPAHWSDMRFDVIIGNPPYQLDAGDTSDVPIYQHFVKAAKSLRPRHIVMITPSRWFAGGKGLDHYRREMLNDRRLRSLVDYPTSAECFPGVEIKGGVSYFHWDANHDGTCLYTSVRDGLKTEPVLRDLASHDVFIRQIEALGILAKVSARGEPTCDIHMSSQTPFGMVTNFSDYSARRGQSRPLLLHALEGGKRVTRYVSERAVTRHPEWVNCWKVLTPVGGAGDARTPNSVMGQPLLAAPGEVCTQTYLVAGVFDTKAEAENFMAYMKTRFFRYLVFLRKTTQHVNAGRLAFVPWLDMSRKWTDSDLFQRYALSEEEVAHIESQVKEMP